MKTYMFPGQGSQKIGMGGDLFDEYISYTKKADKIIGYSIKELCTDDPERKLNSTEFTQVALYVVNALSYYKQINDTGIKPDYVVGHSLGEFNALLAAECFDFEAGLKLVKKRGALMSQATDGGMAAVLNTTEDNIKTILEQNSLTNIDLANYNGPTQIIISGKRDEIMTAATYFRTGEMDYIPLNTSGAFHSRFMQSAKSQFEKYLNKFKFSQPKIPVISNVHAEPYHTEDIISNLSDQIVSPVKWMDSICYLMEQGEMEFIELGVGNVLEKLVDNIRKYTIEKADQKSTETTLSNADEIVKAWNKQYAIGTKVKIESTNQTSSTKSEAKVLFGHRAAIYLEGYKGYFALDEVSPA